jgi:hypothetical protein
VRNALVRFKACSSAGIRGCICRVCCTAPVSHLAILRGRGNASLSPGKFLSAVIASRALPYAGIGFLAAKYGHTILRFLRHPRGLETNAVLIGISVAAFAIVGLFILFLRQSRIYLQRTTAESVVTEPQPFSTVGRRDC